jgi:GT2 family glycosyltransferase
MTLVRNDPCETETRTETRTEPTPRPWIRRNDYSVLEPPPLGGWDPVLSVSVVVPAYGGQEKLDLTLASLAAQTYPAELLEVVVVDDGSEPPLVLPPIRPEHTRIVPSLPGGWARGHAVNSGAAASTADVLLFFDADMIAFREHVEAQLRWHHLADHVAVTGHLRCVDHRPGALSPARVRDAVRGGEPGSLVDGPGEELAWLRRAYDRTDGLRTAGPEVFRFFIGGTGSVRRAFFEEAGGADSELVLGEDTHLGYRFAQHGAVFVPEPAAGSWHLGRPQMEHRKADGARYRAPLVGNRVPLIGGGVRRAGRQWQVPRVDVVVDTTGHRFDDVAGTVDALLTGDTADIRVRLVGEWARVTPDRHAVLDDPAVDVRLVHEHYRCEPRVEFVQGAPDPDPDVPFRLLLRPGPPLARHAVRRMIERAEAAHAGLLRATAPGDDLGGPRLERTGAFARARRVGADGTDLDAVVDDLFGVHWIDGENLLFAAERSEDEPPDEPPDDWSARLAAARAGARAYKERAERLKRRFRWLTGSRGGRLLCRIIG